MAGFGLFATLAVGCVHGGPPAESTTPHEPMPTVASVPPPPVPVEEPEPTAPGMYFGDLADVAPDPLPAFSGAIDTCRDPANAECTVTRTAGYDTRHSRWVVFDVDPGEYAPGPVWLGTATLTEEVATFQGAVTRARVSALRRALTANRAVTPGANLVARATQISYSITGYNALVALGGDLEGWAMWIDPAGANQGYALHLIRVDQSGDRVLAQTSADAHCHDGDSVDGEDAASSDSGTDAAPPARACSPIGIDAVLLSPDRTSLLVLGTRAMAGHGGAPGMHWLVPMPTDLLP